MLSFFYSYISDYYISIYYNNYKLLKIVFKNNTSKIFYLIINNNYF